MASKKPSDFTTATPVVADEIPFIDDPTGTPLNRTTTIDSILSLIEIKDDTTPELGASLECGTFEVRNIGNGNLTINSQTRVWRFADATTTFDIDVEGISGTEAVLSFFFDNANYKFDFASDTICGIAATQTLTNKTLGSGTILGANLDGGSFDITILGNTLMTADETHLIDLTRTTAQADDYTIGEIRFRHDDQGGILVNYGRITSVMGNDLIGAEDGELRFFVTEEGVHDVEYMRFNGVDTETVGKIIRTYRPLILSRNDQRAELSVFRDEVVADTSEISRVSFIGLDDASNITPYSNIRVIMENDEDAGNEAGSISWMIRRDSADIQWLEVNVANDNEIKMDIPNGMYRWDVNAVSEMTLTATTLDVLGNSIDNVLSITSADADPADAGFIRMGNTEVLAWELATPGTDVTIGVNASDDVDILEGTATINLNRESGLAMVRITGYGANPIVRQQKAGGNRTTPVAVGLGENIGNNQWRGWDGADFSHNAGLIRVIANAAHDHDTNIHDSRIRNFNRTSYW